MKGLERTNLQPHSSKQGRKYDSSAKQENFDLNERNYGLQIDKRDNNDSSLAMHDIEGSHFSREQYQDPRQLQDIYDTHLHDQNQKGLQDFDQDHYELIESSEDDHKAYKDNRGLPTSRLKGGQCSTFEEDNYTTFSQKEDSYGPLPSKEDIYSFAYSLVVPKEPVYAHSVVDGNVANKPIAPPDFRKHCHVPIFILGISVLEFVMFFVEKYRNEVEHCGPGLSKNSAPLCSELIYNPKRRHEAWRLISYSLVHSGYIHIFSNILMQIIIGIPLEIVHGSWRVGGIYLIGLVTGSLLTSITDPKSYLCGASGGVYALLLAHLPTLIINWREMTSIIEWLVHLCLLIGGLVSSLYSLYVRFAVKNGHHHGVGISAHIGGGVAGFLVGINLLRNFKHKTWEGILRLVCIVIWSVLMVTMVLFNSIPAASSHFLPTDWSSLPGRSCKEDACG